MTIDILILSLIVYVCVLYSVLWYSWLHFYAISVYFCCTLPIGVTKVGVTQCNNWWRHCFYLKSDNPFQSSSYHSHALRLSQWSVVQCSCKFIRKKYLDFHWGVIPWIVSPGAPPWWRHWLYLVWVETCIRRTTHEQRQPTTTRAKNTRIHVRLRDSLFVVERYVGEFLSSSSVNRIRETLETHRQTFSRLTCFIS